MIRLRGAHLSWEGPTNMPSHKWVKWRWEERGRELGERGAT
jgi:hypothetical protein